MLLMYRSRNNLIMIVEIIKNRGRDYFSNTEHENKISMTQCLDEFQLKAHQTPEQNKTCPNPPNACLLYNHNSGATIYINCCYFP